MIQDKDKKRIGRGGEIVGVVAPPADFHTRIDNSLEVFREGNAEADPYTTMKATDELYDNLHFDLKKDKTILGKINTLTTEANNLFGTYTEKKSKYLQSLSKRHLEGSNKPAEVMAWNDMGVVANQIITKLREVKRLLLEVYRKNYDIIKAKNKEKEMIQGLV